MNVGQVLETMLGLAGQRVGEEFAEKINTMADKEVKVSS